MQKHSPGFCIFIVFACYAKWGIYNNICCTVSKVYIPMTDFPDA